MAYVNAHPLRAVMIEHRHVEAIDDVALLAPEQHATAVVERVPVAVFAAEVYLLPRLPRGQVDDPRLVQALDLGKAAVQVRLVHARLVLEDLLLHGEEERLVEAELARRLTAKVSPRAAERLHELTRGVGEDGEVHEGGIEGRPDHVRHVCPEKKVVCDEAVAVIAVHGLNRLPVLIHTAPGPPTPRIDRGGFHRRFDPFLL